MGALELPEGQYVVGLAGAMLANGSVDRTPEVVLLATDALYDELAREGWPSRREVARLNCPGEPGLIVQAGDVSDTYAATIDELIANAWHEDGLRVVSVLQVDQGSIQQFLSHAVVQEAPDPDALTWTWDRLLTALAALALPRDDYVVGLAGALLANESLPGVDEVELLVTDQLHDALVEAGWTSGDDGVLWCPVEDDLLARAGDVGQTYLHDIPALVADAWSRDGIPLVSMVSVRPEAVRTFVG